jgi:O-antigen/teichoic acid export membrane protein
VKKQSLTAQAIRGVSIRTGISLVVKIFTAMQSFVFARLFFPKDLGVFNTAILVTSIVGLFVEMGLRQYIVADDDDPRRTMDTMLTLTLGLGVGFFAITFLIAAPLAANILDNPDLKNYIRFMSYLGFANLCSLPTGLWEREMRFGISVLPDLAKFFAGFTATVIATWLLGMGVWGLFCGHLVGFLANAVVIWTLAPYRPRLGWDVQKVRKLIVFGYPLLASAVLSFVSWQGDDLLVRLFRGDAELGIYITGFYMSDYLLQIIQMTHPVMLSAFAKVKDNKENLRQAFNLSGKYLAIGSLFLGIGLVVFAPQVIHYLYGDRWAAAIPLVQLFALSAAFRAATGYHWQSLLIIQGRTRHIMVVNALSALFLCLVGAPLIFLFGGLGGAIYSFVQQLVMNPFVRLPVIKKATGDLSYLKKIWQPFVAASVAGPLIYFRVTPWIHSIPTLVLAGVLYSIIYFGVLLLLDRTLVAESLGFVRSLSSWKPVPETWTGSE